MWGFLSGNDNYTRIIILLINLLSTLCGGEGGIRTRGTGLPHTCFPSKLLKPLGHLSVFFSSYWHAARRFTQTSSQFKRLSLILGYARLWLRDLEIVLVGHDGKSLAAIEKAG